jgi:hypothetical protein
MPPITLPGITGVKCGWKRRNIIKPLKISPNQFHSTLSLPMPGVSGDVPIKKDLWRAITQVRAQYRIGEKMIHEVKDFAIVNRLLERVVVRIRSGQLGHHLVFGEYKLPTVYEEFEAAIKRLISTPVPPKKKKQQ